MGIVAGATTYPLERKEFGVHSMAAVNRATGLLYGMAEIIGDVSLAFEASSVDLRGGSSLYPRATEIAEIDSTMSVNVRSFPDWILQTYMAGTVTTTAPSASLGTVSALTNKVNASVSDAVLGIATATLKTNEEANMKTGAYRLEAVSATAVDVFRTSTFQSSRGTNLFLDNDTGKITTSPLTIVDAGASPVEIPGTGIELTGGSGTIAFVTGDVAEFSVTPPHNGISQIDIGVPGNVFPEHELYIYGKQRSSREVVYIHCPKAVCVSGMTYNMSMSDFASTDVSIKLLLDNAQNKVATIYFSAQII